MFDPRAKQMFEFGVAMLAFAQEQGLNNASLRFFAYADDDEFDEVGNLKPKEEDVDLTINFGGDGVTVSSEGTHAYDIVINGANAFANGLFDVE